MSPVTAVAGTVHNYIMRKPNELPEAFMVRMGNYFSGTAREEYYQVAKEISALRTQCSDLEKEIEQRQETEESLTRWVATLGDELDTLKVTIKLERKEHLDYIQCDRNDGDKYRAARYAVDKLLEE